MNHLLTCCSLDLDGALAMRQAQLYSLLGPQIAADPRLLSAAAALLRSAHVRDCLLTDDQVLFAINEDQELAPQELCAFLVDANHRSAEDRVAICEALASKELELDEVSRPDVAQGLLGNSTGILAEPGSAVVEYTEVTVAANTTSTALSACSTLAIFSEHLDDAWRFLGARDTQIRAMFAEIDRRGLRVAAKPSAEALQVGAEAGEHLPRVLGFHWHGHGWLLGEIVARNTNAGAHIGGNSINFFAS